jgi:hypothetical protein
MDEPSLAACAPNSFAKDLCSSVRTWLSSAVAALIVSWWLAENGFAMTMREWVVWLPIGMLLVPIGFTFGLACCVVVLAILLGILALPAWLTGRPIGLMELLIDAWQLAAGVLPGFWRALRRVRKPALWGAALGVFVGTMAQFAIHA